jgi:hypothetical protein
MYMIRKERAVGQVYIGKGLRDRCVASHTPCLLDYSNRPATGFLSAVIVVRMSPGALPGSLVASRGSVTANA